MNIRKDLKQAIERRVQSDFSTNHFAIASLILYFVVEQGIAPLDDLYPGARWAEDLKITDPLEFAEIVLFLEEKLKTRFHDDEFSEAATLQDVVDVVYRKTQKDRTSASSQPLTAPDS